MKRTFKPKPITITKTNLRQFLEDARKILDEADEPTHYFVPFGYPWGQTELKPSDIVRLVAREVQVLKLRNYPDEWIERKLIELVETL